MCGVYPIANALAAGKQISSTDEGRHVTMLESELKHPANADGLVDKGNPVILCLSGVEATFGKAVGVAFDSAVAATDYIAIDTEGIWVQSVVASNDAGGIAVVPGDELFINTTTCVISKIRNIATQIPFGYALGNIAATLTGRIAVKVHFDPTVDSEVAQFNTVASGAYGKSMRATLAGGASEGLSGYHEGHLTALQTGHIYNFGSWINIDAISLANGSILVPYEGGIWAGTAQALARVVFAGQHQAILAGAPASMHAWRLNVAAAGGAITALIAAANPGSVGYSPGTAGTGVIGTIPIADVVGTGVVYIDVHGAIA